MKKNIVQIILLFLIIIVFNSCEKDATNIELPQSEPKLVVTCFISPQDTVIDVSISLSEPVFGPNNSSNSNSNEVENATVIISDGTTSEVVPYVVFSEKYSLPSTSFPIIAGKTYYLTVTTPDGKKATSNCTVPLNNLSVASITIDSSYSNEYGYESYKHDIKVAFNDISNESNYYKAYCIYSYSYTYPGYSNVYSYKEPLYSLDRDDLFNDENENERYVAEFTRYYSVYNSDIEYNEQSYTCYLLNTDQPFYQYQLWLATNDGGVFTEPISAYTNINGGFGVFCAFQKFEIAKPF